MAATLKRPAEEKEELVVAAPKRRLLLLPRLLTEPVTDDSDDSDDSVDSDVSVTVTLGSEDEDDDAWVAANAKRGNVVTKEDRFTEAELRAWLS